MGQPRFPAGEQPEIVDFYDSDAERLPAAVKAICSKHPERYWRRPGVSGLFLLDVEEGILQQVPAFQWKSDVSYLVRFRNPDPEGDQVVDERAMQRGAPIPPRPTGVPPRPPGGKRGATKPPIREINATEVVKLYNDGHWPELSHIRYAPWYTPEGRLVNRPGFDEETGVYLHWAEDEVACPSRFDGPGGEERVHEVLQRALDFSFAHDADKVAYLAALLQTVHDTRDHSCPLLLVNSLSEGAGKTVALTLLNIVASGCRSFYELTLSKRDLMQELELRSVLAASTLPSLIYFDNTPQGLAIDSPLLQQIATAQGAMHLRRPGEGALSKLSPRGSLWAFAGVRLDVDQEMARRLSQVRLEHRSRAYRTLTPDILGWATARRVELVSALLWLVRRWHEVGCPDPTRSLPSFAEWSERIGGTICAMGPRWASAWLDETQAPIGRRERLLIELLSPRWNNETSTYEPPIWPIDASGRFEKLGAKRILMQADVAESDLVTEFGPPERSGSSSKLGGFLAGLSERPLRGWYFGCSISGNNKRYYPCRHDPRTTPTPSGPYDPPADGVGGGSGGSRRVATQPSAATMPINSAFTEGAEGAEGVSPSGLSHPHSHLLSRPPDPPPIPPHPPRMRMNSASQPRTPGAQPSAPGSAPPPTPVSPPPPLPTPIRGGGTLGVSLQDPARNAVADMALRGVRVDVERWNACVQDAIADLEGSQDPEDVDRLRQLYAYEAPIRRQAEAGQRVTCEWHTQTMGRIGTRSPNLQGITKAYGLRSAFRPEPGHRYVIADWRSAHVWIAAAMARDPDLLLGLVNGDLYDRSAEVWCPELSGKAARKCAKICTLASLNGGDGPTLARILTAFAVAVGDDTMRQRREAWFGRYPQLRRFVEWLDQAKPRTFTTLLGQTFEHRPGTPLQESRRRLALQWQAPESDALRRVLMAFWREAVFVLHDSITLEVPEGHAERFAHELRKEMTVALRNAAPGLDEMCTELGLNPVTLDTATVRIAESWDEQTDDDLDLEWLTRWMEER